MKDSFIKRIQQLHTNIALRVKPDKEKMKGKKLIKKMRDQKRVGKNETKMEVGEKTEMTRSGS